MVDWFGRKKQRARRELWQRIANELGGTFHLPTGFWNQSNERIEVSVAGCSVAVETYVVQQGNAHEPHTEIAATVQRGPAPRLLIAKHTMLADLGNMFKDDVQLGLAPFDKAFVVRCDQPAVARRFLTTRTLEILLTRFLNARLECKDQCLRLYGRGAWNNEQEIRDGISLVVELATRDIFGREALEAVEGGTPGTDGRGWPHTAIPTSVRVVIGPDDIDGKLVMVARTTEPHRGEPFSLELQDGVPSDTARMSKLPPGAHVALRHAGTGTLSATPVGMFLRWTTLELDPKRLEAAADLLGALAAHPDGNAYR